MLFWEKEEFLDRYIESDLGQQVLTAQPEYVLIPSIALVITVVALNTLGDALRERWGVQ